VADILRSIYRLLALVLTVALLRGTTFALRKLSRKHHVALVGSRGYGTSFLQCRDSETTNIFVPEA